MFYNRRSLVVAKKIGEAFCEGFLNLKCKPHTQTDKQTNEFKIFVFILNKIINFFIDKF
jgi:hypothetical protein